jgi:spore germination protein GerM
MVKRTLAVGGLLVIVFALGYAMFAALPRLTSRLATKGAGTVAPASVPTTPGRKIKARLFYVAEDGTGLTSVERDVPYGEAVIDQAREIVAAQLTPVVEPLVSAVPPGTTLRAVFITDSGDAYVDLSREVVTAHSGGTLNELLTVYTVVNVLTANLPAITSVQLLVDGKEVETLAGHVDLRRPLVKNLAWVQ